MRGFQFWQTKGSFEAAFSLPVRYSGPYTPNTTAHAVAKTAVPQAVHQDAMDGTLPCH
jgi:hypothetical protein